MAYMASARRALTDLPINTSAMPHPANSSTGTPTNLKRQIDELEDPEYPSNPSRLRIYSGKLRPETSRRDSKEEVVGRIVKVTSPDRATQHGQPGTDCMEEMDEGVSQNSSKDSTCSPPECDLGDETMASQETAATDVSHLALPMARIYAETLRLRLRVALFKVQTNQTNIPMSQLSISMNEPKKPADIASSLMVEGPPQPKLLPAPVLRPTASPARAFPRQHLPPSPLNSKNNTPGSVAEASHSPSSPGSRRELQPVLIQTSSPPDSPGYVRVRASKNESAMRSTVTRKSPPGH